MLIRLDLSSETPIYSQIARSIRSQVNEGVIGQGDRLPAARGLADSLDVNVHTVLKAYSELEGEGLVEVRRGRGGVVVTGEGGLGDAVRLLVSRARKAGATRAQVLDMLKEAW